MGLNEAQKKERSEFLEENLEITECSQRKPYVFISYASDDWKTVFGSAVVPMQKEHGLSVYADKAFDKVNDKWIVPMLRNVRGANAMVAFISQSYIESYACFLELLTAVNNKKQIVFVSLEGERHLGDTTDLPAVERGVKNEILKQGSDISTNTNSDSNDIMRAMKSAYTSLSTLLEQDALSKYDISDAFIGFFRDANVNFKTINDLRAVRETIESVDPSVFSQSPVRKAGPERQPALEPGPEAAPSSREQEDRPRFREAGAAPRDMGAAPRPAGSSVKDRLFQAAQAGDSRAMGELGLHYLLGDMAPEIPRDLAKSVNWLDRSAQQEDAGAKRLLGHLCSFGGQEIQTCLGLDDRSRDMIGYQLLGGDLYWGLGYCFDRSFQRHEPAQRRYEYESAQKQYFETTAVDSLYSLPLEHPDYPVSRYFLGTLFYSLYGGTPKTAKEQLIVAAEKGCVQAMYCLAEYFAGKMRGAGKRPNGSEALKWYQMAAEAEPAGLSDAVPYEAALYFGGRISDTLPYRKEEKGCCRRARYQLAECYKGIDKWDFISDAPDREKIDRWTQRAKELDEDP